MRELHEPEVSQAFSLQVLVKTRPVDDLQRSFFVENSGGSR